MTRLEIVMYCDLRLRALFHAAAAPAPAAAARSRSLSEAAFDAAPSTTIDTLPVSSDTTMATESFSSVRPIAARWRDPESLAQLRVHGQRQEAGGRSHAILLHDDGAVVERRSRQENALQQVVGQDRVEADAAFDVVAQADLPLDAR